MFATASAPPNETRSGHSEMLSSSSDARLLLQMSPGMDVIPLHPQMLSETRDVRFSRQLGTYGEISLSTGRDSNSGQSSTPDFSIAGRYSCVRMPSRVDNLSHVHVKCG